MQGPFSLPGHALRAVALGEVHSRPFHLLDTPRVVLTLAFLGHGFAEDLAILADLARARGTSPPDSDARHFSLDWTSGRLRWERHTEFSSWTWDGPAPPRFHDRADGHPFGSGFRAPAPLIAAARLDLRPGDEEEAVLAAFDPTSLCLSEMENGLARAATDFRQDGDGFTRIVVFDHGLGPARAGALAQRLLEVETYRTLATLGLPEAQRLGGEIAAIETDLASITAELRDHSGRDSRGLLDRLIDIAARLEASAVGSLYRFAASRAYDQIVEERLAVISEHPVAGYETWGGFLRRRLAPAMRTCRSVEDRQARLSEKLARTANLLRTRVDVELESQNRDLLVSMNRRARLQLRLQQTVEGLSVVAVSYYALGLVGYLAHGASEAGLAVDPVIAVALAVPLVVAIVWLAVRRIRRHHSDGEDARAP